MAKRRKKVSRKGGSVSLGAVVPEMLSGMQKMGISGVVPPVVGGGGAVLATVAASKYGGKISPKIPEMAPLAGAVGGALLSLPLLWWKDSSAALQGMLTAGLVGLALFAVPKIQQAMSGVVIRQYGRPYGLLEARPVGALPEVTDSGETPYAVQQTMDMSAYGQVP